MLHCRTQNDHIDGSLILRDFDCVIPYSFLLTFVTLQTYNQKPHCISCADETSSHNMVRPPSFFTGMVFAIGWFDNTRTHFPMCL